MKLTYPTFVAFGWALVFSTAEEVTITHTYLHKDSGTRWIYKKVSKYIYKKERKA